MKDSFAPDDEVLFLRDLVANDNRTVRDPGAAHDDCDVPALVNVDPFDDAVTAEYLPFGRRERHRVHADDSELV